MEGIVYRFRTGIPWRDLPREPFGLWQTVFKRHRRYAGDGTWDRVLAQILAEADTRPGSTPPLTAIAFVIERFFALAKQ